MKDTAANTAAAFFSGAARRGTKVSVAAGRADDEDYALIKFSPYLSPQPMDPLG
jgi:hypothetical protein